MNNITPDDLLKEPIVLKQELQGKPILEFKDFEFSQNNKYQPILLRILLNSINIFNYKFDLEKKNDSKFPIGIEIATGDYGENIMIMFTLSKSNILRKLLEKGEELFPDLERRIKDKIDINLEEKGRSNEKFTRLNYINGLDFESNAISKLISYIKEDDVQYLPNMFFYIKEDSRIRISNELNLNYVQTGQRNLHSMDMEKVYFGYNEFDLYIELKQNLLLPKDFECVYCKENSEQKENNQNIEFPAGKRLAFEFKVSHYKIPKDCVNKLYSKTKVLSQSLYKHGFINNNEFNNDILILGIDCDKYETYNFYQSLDLHNINNFIGLYIDIAVKFYTIFRLSDEIEKSKEENEKVKKECQKIKMDCDSKIEKVKMECDTKIETKIGKITMEIKKDYEYQIEQLKMDFISQISSLRMDNQDKNEKAKI